MSPSIAITSMTGSFPGLMSIWATHEDDDDAYVFRVVTALGEGQYGPWLATATGAGKVGQGSSYLGPQEAAMKAMQDALTV